jgi:hypothetical protein
VCKIGWVPEIIKLEKEQLYLPVRNKMSMLGCEANLRMMPFFNKIMNVLAEILMYSSSKAMLGALR